MNEYIRIGESTAMESLKIYNCSYICFFLMNIWGLQISIILLDRLLLVNNLDFQGCYEALIACIISEKIACLHEKVCTLDTIVNQLLY